MAGGLTVHPRKGIDATAATRLLRKSYRTNKVCANLAGNLTYSCNQPSRNDYHHQDAVEVK